MEDPPILLIAAVVTVLLFTPPIVIAAFWWVSVRRPSYRLQGQLPDSATIVFVRLGGVICAVLPIVQLFAGMIRYRTGELGTFLWFVLPGLGLLLALFDLAGLLAHARGYERPVSSGMLLLSVGMLLLLTFLGGSNGG